MSDNNNHRVMKWVKDGKDRNYCCWWTWSRKQSDTSVMSLWGVIVDDLGQVYVADCGNNRIVRWSKGSNEGRVFLGGNGSRQQPNQFNGPTSLSFDREGNLYVTDWGNNRIQRFDIDYK